MKATIHLLFLAVLSLMVMTGPGTVYGQGSGYEFNEQVRLPATSVKNQGNSGTCWSYATLSFLESELLRKERGRYDLSEMYIVREAYLDRAELYVRFHGHLNFGPGAQAWDVLHVMDKEGLVPQKAYPGEQKAGGLPRHGQMDAVLQAYMQEVIKNHNDRLSSSWKEGFRGILDAYLGDAPGKFQVEQNTYEPHKFVNSLGLDPADYMPVTSFENHDFYDWYVFESPDNWSMEQIFNVPLDELVRIVEHSLEQGYSVAWAADVTNPGFNFGKGLAVLPQKSWQEMDAYEQSQVFEHPVKQQAVTMDMRQRDFDQYATTDDHLMHITGMAEDQNGTRYFIVKNSHGSANPYQGYLYVSRAYFRLKTTSLLINRESLPSDIAGQTGK